MVVEVIPESAAAYVLMSNPNTVKFWIEYNFI